MCYIIQKIEEKLRNLLHSLLCWLSDEGRIRPKFGISIEQALLFIPDGRYEKKALAVQYTFISVVILYLQGRYISA
jgi:hypothetical protein